MNENARTVTFVAAAAVLIAVAWLALPRTDFSPASAGVVNQPLLPDFKEPSTARDLEIVRWDQDAAKVQKFRVTRSEGRWTIPSKAGYPADAEHAMAELAGSLVDLKISSLVGTEKDQHREFGVVDPGAPTFAPAPPAPARASPCAASRPRCWPTW